MPTPRFPGATNLFMPAATRQVIGFLLEPGRFKLWDYVQKVGSSGTDKAGKPVCFFTTIDPDAPVRVVADADYSWEDGEDAPEGTVMPNFTTTEVRMFRRAYPYRAGEQMVDTAELFQPLPLFRQIALMHAMINKTARVWSLLDTAANWGANTADANTLNGGRGKWDTSSATEGSPNYMAINRSVTAAVKAVNLATNSVVQPQDMRLVISPDLAEAGGNSGEIRDYLKGSVYAKAVQEGKEKGRNQQYGFPDMVAGVEVVVEDASRVSERPNVAGTAATANRGYIKNGTSACLMSRQGGLEGVEGAPTFSTVQVYYWKYEMAVEEQHDVWNKRHDGRVLDLYKEVLAASRAGYLITNCK